MGLYVQPSTLRSLPIAARSFPMARSHASSVYVYPSRLHDPAVTTTPTDITRRQRDILDIALRVDQAGEIAANWIYRGQMAILGRDPIAGPIIQVCHLRLYVTRLF